MSPQIGFGTYRVTDQSPEHIASIVMAVENGVRLIDTSSNYMDGHAEIAIARALGQCDAELASEVEIVSKFGYIQGSNMQRMKEGESFDDAVEFSPSCFHSIAPSFMRDQLALTLQRLERDVLDCYLLHNPEYYLLDALNRGVDRAEMLDTMMERIYRSFVALEEEIKLGRIRSYGISSNSFSKPANDPEFLPYEDLVTLACNAAEEVGNARHGFTTIQLPMNLLENDGKTCASWAKTHGLRVLVNRPLNASLNNLMHRLAEYDSPKEYDLYLNALLELCDNEPLRALYNLIGQLDDTKHRFGWIGEFEQFLYAQVIPHFRNVLSTLEEDARYSLAESLNLFIESYRQMVAFECSKRTRVELKEQLEGCTASLQECALKHLSENDDIDFILVGMRKPSYVTDIMGIPL